MLQFGMKTNSLKIFTHKMESQKRTSENFVWDRFRLGQIGWKCYTFSCLCDYYYGWIQDQGKRAAGTPIKWVAYAQLKELQDICHPTKAGVPALPLP